MLALATAAAATERVRLGTMVLNNDMRNPVQLAWEAATLDRLSGGRFELGLGAGHTPAEYAATGIGLGSAAVRKRRLMESVEVLKALLAGETVTHSGVGGNGARLLEHAGRFADIVGLQGMGRTLADGHRHEVNWTIEHLEAQIDQVRAGAGDRFGDVELSALVQLVAVTNDAAGVLEPLVDRVDGLTMDAAAAAPYLLVGTEAEIVDKVKRCRDQWGITYFVVRELDAMQPIITACRG
jgi:probable F420-dependent oxidoreductase